MRIEILESEIKHAPYGVMLRGEIRVVDEQFGRFAVANGWAKHLPAEGEELIACGERACCDGHDPATWQPGDPPKRRHVQPHSVTHRSTASGPERP